jgi:hypothetical protein
MNPTVTFFLDQIARVCDADLRRCHRPTAYVAGTVSVHDVAATFAMYAALEAAEARWHDENQPKQA